MILRNEAAIKSLRNELKRLQDSKNPIGEMKQEILRSLLSDVRKFKPSKKDKAINIVLDVLGFVPAYGSVFGGVDLIRDLSELSKRGSTWTTILLTLGKYSKIKQNISI